MIHPNMATMLCFITTDAAIAPELLQKALLAACRTPSTWSAVDGDTSTNDTVCGIWPTALAKTRDHRTEDEDYDDLLPGC